MGTDCLLGVGSFSSQQYFFLLVFIAWKSKKRDNIKQAP